MHREAAQKAQWLPEAEFQRELSRKAAACARLLAIADGLTGRRIELEPIVVLDEWSRATKTYRAAVMVAATGYGQQAQVLARSVFESAMLISWAMRHPREADEQVQLHTLLGLERHLEARRNAGFWSAKPLASDLSAADRERAISLFGKRGTAFWSGHRTLEDLVKENIAELEDPFLIAQYKAVFYVFIAWANRMAHSTGLSTRGQRSENPNDPDATQDTAVLITGPSRHQVFDALHTALTSYLMVMYALPDTVEPNLATQLREVGGIAWRAWKDPRELEGLADDGPCPCDEPNTIWGNCHKWTERLVDLDVERGVTRSSRRAPRKSGNTRRKRVKRRR